MLNYLLFGKPASGKGTASQMIVEKYGLAHVSTGNLLRREQAIGSRIGKLADTLIDKGHFMPDDLVFEMVKSFIIESDNKSGFVFDGFPRTIKQGKMIHSTLFQMKTPITRAFFFDVPDHIASKRILNRADIEGRKDDRQELIDVRLNEFKALTMPVVAQFRQMNLVTDIDSTLPIDDIRNIIIDCIESDLNK
jgi:adenylate kinase